MEVPCSFRFIGNGGELKKLKSSFKTTPIGSDNNGDHLSANKLMALDSSICTTEQLLSKDKLIQITSSNIAIVEHRQEQQ